MKYWEVCEHQTSDDGLKNQPLLQIKYSNCRHIVTAILYEISSALHFQLNKHLDRCSHQSTETVTAQQIAKAIPNTVLYSTDEQ